MDIIIFGTGSNGDRAWQAAQATPGIRVVAFADNDPRKQGATCHDLPVLSADDLLTTPFDVVLVASMYRHDIVGQLGALGLEGSRVEAGPPNRYADALRVLAEQARAREVVRLDSGDDIARAALPRVLVLTYETLNGSHGTGVLLQRYFRDFPADHLFSVCHTATGEPWLTNALTLPAEGIRDRAGDLAAALQRRSFVPTLVYATAFNENDLDLLEVVLSVIPGSVPVVQHFMDYMPHDPASFDTRIRAMGHRLTEIWALTDGLRGELTARYARPVNLVTALHQVPPREFKTVVRDEAAEARAVILGNVWQPWTLPVVREAWRRCRVAVPGLRPIDWYVHPVRVQAVMEAGYELGEEVRWAGFHSGESLQRKLREADIAILPFNVDAHAVDSYGRFSLPSRLTELCGAGLPIVALASDDTEPARFLAEHACGLSAAGPGSDALTAKLLDVIGDAALRARLGARGRHVAETAFAFEPFHTRLVSTFVRLAGSAPADAVAVPARRERLERLAGSERVVSAALDGVLADRVHYACGRNVVDGWLNVDGFDASYPWGAVPDDVGARIYRMDLTGPHPFPADHFRLGYSEDFVEHIDQASLVAFLCEAFRTFAPGGVLRLSTPSLSGILRRHLRGADWPAANVLHEEAYVRWMHAHFLDLDEITTIARHIGWREVRSCPYGTSSIPELVLDSRPDQADLNLVVELIK